MSVERSIVIREPMYFYGPFELYVTEYPSTIEGAARAGKKLRKEGYPAKEVSILTGEGGMFLSRDFIELIRDAARRGRPVFDLFFHCPSLWVSDRDEGVKVVANPIEVMLKEIGQLYQKRGRGSEAAQVREAVRSAIQEGVLRPYLLRQRADTPHSAIIDNSKLLIQQKHARNSEAISRYWFVENAMYLLRKYRADHARMRQTATPLFSDVHRHMRT